MIRSHQIGQIAQRAQTPATQTHGAPSLPTTVSLGSKPRAKRGGDLRGEEATLKFSNEDHLPNMVRGSFRPNQRRRIMKVLGSTASRA